MPYTRTRVTADTVNESWIYRYDHPGTQNPASHAEYSIGTHQRWTSRRRIDDVIDSTARFKPVGQYVQRHSSGVSLGSWANSDGATISRRSTWIPLPDPDFFPAGYTLPLVSSGTVQLAVDNAFIAMSEQVPTEVNILNFGYELRELGDLIPSLAQGLSRTVSGQYLNYQFGVKPLVGDLKKLGSILKTVESRLAYLRETWGKRVRVGHREEFDVDLPTSNATYTPIQGVEVRYKPVQYRGYFVATGYIFHMLQNLYGIEATIRGATSALGLLDPTEAVWNAIPFSFVLDWFGRLGNVLARLDTLQPFPGEWRCIDFGYSTTEYLVHLVEMYWLNTNTKIGSGFVTLKRYTRRVGLPVNSSQLIGTGSLTTSQQLLSVALLNSTRKH